MYKTRMKGNALIFLHFEQFLLFLFFFIEHRQRKLKQMSVVITMSENGINLQAESYCTGAAQEEEHTLATIGWPRRSFFYFFFSGFFF